MAQSRTIAEGRFGPWIIRLVLLLTLATVVLSGGCSAGDGAGVGRREAAIAEACGFATGDAMAVTPNIECVAYDDDGRRHAIFSYSATSRVVLPIGAANRMNPEPQGRGQPASFSVGAHKGAFSVDMPEDVLTWWIGGLHYATATLSTRVCPTVGDFADVTGVGPGGLLVDLHSDHGELAGAILPTDVTPSGEQGEVVVGKLAGKFDTGADGSVSYGFPLWTPPGRAGIQPSLSISYSSEAGDGPLGVGFSLGGLSHITRCAKTFAEDGTTEAISFVDTDLHAGIAGDKYCLDGAALVPADNDGTRVTAYRTRHESFSRITVEEFDELGPKSFRVETKDGQIFRYGTSPGSRLENMRVTLSTVDTKKRPDKPCYPPPGEICVPPPDVDVAQTTATYATPARLGWAISEVSDRSENRMVIDYRLSSVGGVDCSSPTSACGSDGVEQLPARISYTWQGQDEPGRRLVNFAYAVRPDVSHRWVSGFKLVHAQRLTFIQMEAPMPEVTGLVKLYALGYESSPESGRSRLLSLQECDGGGRCQAPTTFGYGGAPEAGRHTYVVEGGPKLDFPGPHPVVPGSHPDLSRVYSTDEQYDPNGELIVLDINGDGLDDILFRSRERTILTDSSPQHTLHVPDYFYRLSEGERFGDAQIAGIDTVDVPADPTPCETFYEAGDPATKIGRLYQRCFRPMPRAIDVDMDGIPEIHDGRTLYRWNGARYVRVDGPTTDAIGDFLNTGLYVADLDGDSLPELMPLGDTPGRFFTAPDCKGNFLEPIVYGPGSPRPSTTFVADWNGGGKHGLLVGKAAVRYEHFDVARDDLGFHFAGGTSSELVVSRGELNSLSYVFADMNGDGLDDAIEIPNSEYAGWELRGMRENTGVGFLAPVALNGAAIEGGHPRFYAIDALTSLAGDMHIRVFDKRGDGLAKAWSIGSLGPTPFSPLAILDMNGDGNADILTQPDPNGGFVVQISDATLGQPHRADLLRVVHDIGVAFIDYGVFRGRTDDERCVGHFAHCLVRGRTVVRGFSRYLGSQAIQSAAIDWFDGAYGLAGRGFLGFGRRRITDRLTGTVSETTFDNLSPMALEDGFSGTVLSETQTTPLGDGRSAVRTTRYEYEIRPGSLGPGPRLPMFLQMKHGVDDSVEVSGPTTRVLRHFETTNYYDDWGNVIQSDLQGGGSTRRLSTEFTNDQVSWLLGLPRRFEVVATASDDYYVRRRTIAMDYDWRGRIIARTFAPEGDDDERLVVSYDYDSHGLLSEMSQRDNHGERRLIKSVTYDPREHMFAESETDALGHVRRVLVHPAFGTPVRFVDVNGVATHRQYDGFGRSRHLALADGGFVDTHYTLDATVTVVRKTNRFGHVSTSRVDEAGRLIDERMSGALARDVVTQFAYDLYAHPMLPSWISSRHFLGDPGYGDTMTYDSLGRVLTQTHADGTVASRTYEGLTTITHDESGDESLVTTDTLGRVVVSAQTKDYRITDGKPVANRVTTRFQYTALDELSQVIDSDGNTVFHNYDDRGRLLATSDPDAGQRTVKYDAFGDVVEAYDGAGARSSFEFDALGRILATQTKDGVACFDYDTAPHGVGMLATSSADGVQTEYAYDSLGRSLETSWTIDGERFTFGTIYDAATGQISALTYPTVHGLTPRAEFGYAAGLAASAKFNEGGPTSPSIPIWDAIQRDAHGTVTEEHLGNGLTTARTFSPQRGYLTSIETGVGPAGSMHDKVQSITLSHREDGSVDARSDLIAGYDETFRYDGLNELTHWDSIPRDPDHTPEARSIAVDYDYDDIGNMRWKRQTDAWGGGGNVVDYRVGGGSGGPHAIADDSSMPGHFEYDPNGNQVVSPTRPSVTYTAFDLPRDIATGTSNVHFTYDAANRRVKKEDDSGTTTLTLGPYERRVDAVGTTTHVLHVPGGAEIVRTERGGVLVESYTRYLHRDALGSVQVVTDEAASVVERRRYEPFGRRISVDDPTAPAPASSPVLTIGFTGQGSDDELGLVDMGGRIFDPTTARFLTPDPVVASPHFAPSWNRYSYVWNDPVNLTDPSGFSPTCDELSAGCGGISVGDILNAFGSFLGFGGGGGGRSESGDSGPCAGMMCSTPAYPHTKTTPLAIPTLGAAHSWAHANAGGDNNASTTSGNGNAFSTPAAFAITPALNPFGGFPTGIGGVYPVAPKLSLPFGIDVMNGPGTFVDQQRLWHQLYDPTYKLIGEFAKATLTGVNALGTVTGVGGLLKAGITLGAGLIAGEAVLGETLFAVGEVAGAETIGTEVGVVSEGAIVGESQIARAADAAENLTTTNEAMEHVLERHAFGSPARNAGKYASTVDIPELIKETVAKGSLKPGNNPAVNSFVFEMTFSTPIGISRAGADAYRMRVVLQPSGALVTAFPW